MDDEKIHPYVGTRRVNLIILTLFLLPLSWLGVYWVELQVFLNLSCNEAQDAVNQEQNVVNPSLRKPSNGHLLHVTNNPTNNMESLIESSMNTVTNQNIKNVAPVKVDNNNVEPKNNKNNNNNSIQKNNQNDDNSNVVQKNRQNNNNGQNKNNNADVQKKKGNNKEDDAFKNTYSHKFLYNNNDDRSARPRSMLCLYEGDEGSTVMTEALRLHPHVYSPEWRVEPANYRLWPQEEFTLQKQLDAIRFLLLLPSNTTDFQVKLPEPIPLEDYRKRSADSQAIYIKVNVCRTIRKNRQKYNNCIAEAFSLLTCGTDHDTVDDLILPLRYGFDRICSLYIHSDRQIYKHFSQFGGGEKTWEPSPGVLSISKEIAEDYVDRQKVYVTNFMENMRLADEVCPNQKQRSKVHVFDYDRAKKVGMEQALKDLFEDLDLSHDQEHVDLGDFGQRKPGNYCARVFDEESRNIWTQQQIEYNKWLESFCTHNDASNDEPYPWCVSGIPIVEI